MMLFTLTIENLVAETQVTIRSSLITLTDWIEGWPVSRNQVLNCQVINKEKVQIAGVFSFVPVWTKKQFPLRFEGRLDWECWIHSNTWRYQHQLKIFQYATEVLNHPDKLVVGILSYSGSAPSITVYWRFESGRIVRVFSAGRHSVQSGFWNETGLVNLVSSLLYVTRKCTF